MDGSPLSKIQEPKEFAGSPKTTPLSGITLSDRSAQAVVEEMAKRRQCCWGLCKQRSAVYRTFMPLIKEQQKAGLLSDFHKTWLKYAFVIYLQDIDSKSMAYQTRFRNIRRSLIVLGVVISGLIIVSETTYVADHFKVKFALFWITMAVSLTNNFVTAFLTDMKLAEQAVLYYRGASAMKAMGNTFLTCTQRYSAFSSPSAAFRTFVRDIEMCKLLITSENIALMSSGTEVQPEDETLQTRQNWSHLMDPLPSKEASEMNEVV